MHASRTSTVDESSVAELLRGEVLHGDYAPGQRLVEAELCARWGVGRAAVREALRLLAGDGLVELEPHRGARVRLITAEQAIELAEVRTAVECFVARRAAARITPEEAEELREIVTRTRSAVTSFDPASYSEHNELLHRRIGEIAAHAAATEVVERLRLQLVRFQMRLSLQPGRALATLDEHERLVDAIATGDPDLADAAMRAHLEGATAALRSLTTSAPTSSA